MESYADGEARPLIVGGIDDGANDSGTDERTDLIGNTEQGEKHVFFARRDQFRHDGLGISVERCSENTEPHLVNPHLTHIMETNGLRAQANAAPYWHDKSEYVGHLQHGFGLKLKELLNIQEAQAADDRRNGLD